MGRASHEKEVCILKVGDQWAQKEEANLHPHTLLDSLTIVWLV